MTGVDSSPPVIVSADDAARYSLRDGVAAVQVGRDLVFMDLQSDQYSCLSDPPGMKLEGSGLRFESSGLAEALLAAGLVRSGVVCATPKATPTARPTRNVGVQAVARVELSEVCDFLICWAEGSTRFRGRSIAALRSQVRGSNGPMSRPDDRLLLRRVSVFEALLPWIPLPGACLWRSYVLLRFLQRGGCDAQWVFGVRTWPFEAHCWLQVDDLALDDRSERLVRFKPILAF